MDWKALQAASSDSPDDAAWRAMRAPMERAIAEAQRPARSRPAPLTGARVRRTGVAGLALAAASALVLAIVLVAAPVAPSSAEAAAVLQRAADRAAATAPASGPTVLSVRSQELEGISHTASGGADVALHREGRTLLRIPGGQEEWVRKRWTVSRSFAFGDRALAADDLDDPVATAEHPMIERSRTGAFVNNPTPRARAAFGEYPSDYRNLPRDPQALLAALQDAARQQLDPSADGVLEVADMVLISGLAGPDLQASLYAALQRLPGITVVDHDATDLEGRHGVGIGVADDEASDWVRQVLVIDPATGRYLGERVYAAVDVGVIPEGSLMSVTAVDNGLPADCCGVWTPAKGDRALQYP